MISQLIITGEFLAQLEVESVPCRFTAPGFSIFKSADGRQCNRAKCIGCIVTAIC